MFKKVFVSVLALGIVSGAYASDDSARQMEQYKSEKAVYDKSVKKFQKNQYKHAERCGVNLLGGCFSTWAIVTGYTTVFAPILIFPVGLFGLATYHGMKARNPNASLPKWPNFRFNPFGSKK